MDIFSGGCDRPYPIKPAVAGKVAVRNIFFCATFSIVKR
jgi:hypothetical protein